MRQEKYTYIWITVQLFLVKLKHLISIQNYPLFCMKQKCILITHHREFNLEAISKFENKTSSNGSALDLCPYIKKLYIYIYIYIYTHTERIMFINIFLILARENKKAQGGQSFICFMLVQSLGFLTCLFVFYFFFYLIYFLSP